MGSPIHIGGNERFFVRIHWPGKITYRIRFSELIPHSRNFKGAWQMLCCGNPRLIGKKIFDYFKREILGEDSNG